MKTPGVTGTAQAASVLASRCGYAAKAANPPLSQPYDPSKGPSDTSGPPPPSGYDSDLKNMLSSYFVFMYYTILLLERPYKPYCSTQIFCLRLIDLPAFW